MIEFILNDRTVRSDAPSGTTVLDIVRYHAHLCGTKIGCREGDCGACTVLVGELQNRQVDYRAMTSCLLAMANVHGKHIVTVEGLTTPLEHGAGAEKLSMVQQAMVEQGATQCGFCTPGFVVSLSGCCLSRETITPELAVRSIDGNICRCTGYKSIERAASDVARALAGKSTEDPVGWSVEHGLVPPYFKEIAERLAAIPPRPAHDGSQGGPILSGGTDLYVQQHDRMQQAQARNLFGREELRGIRIKDGYCTVGGATVASDLLASAALKEHFPKLEKHLLLVSSTPIRNMGTLAGNFVNASPIGDLTALFIALGAEITLQAPDGTSRQLPLRKLYKGYKDLDRSPDDVLVRARFKLPDARTRFNFEKVSKRTYLDIASVNSAIRLEMDGPIVREALLSAGGVAPVPKLLEATSAFLAGKEASAETLLNAVPLMNAEIAPISDARGTADYKRLLLRQLLFAHFMELFPDRFKLKELV